MLKRHDKHIHRLWLATDGTLAGGVFAALLLLPPLQRLESITRFDLVSVGLLGAVVAIGWPLCMIRFDVYRTQRREPLLRSVVRLATADILMAGIVAGLAFVLDVPVAPVFPLVLAGVLLGLQLTLQIPVRLILRHARRSGHNYRNLLIVGAGPRAREASETIARHPEWGIVVRGFVDDGHDGFRPSVPAEQVFRADEVASVLRAKAIDEVLVACPRSMLEQIAAVVRECALVGIPVTLLTDLFGTELPPPRVGSFESLGTLSFAPVHHDELGLGVKRALDVTGAVVGLLVAAPVLVTAGLAIRLSTRGPIFFRQLRLGRNGHPFEMLKLRTMVENAESRKAELMHLNEMDGPVFKIRNDPRVTPVGRWLRRWSIDELPQLWNVLRGDMSLVGPRPPTPDEVDQYARSVRRRLSMRPGLTCLWQVSGRNEVEFEEWMKLDLEYIDTWSLGSDLRILLRTIPEVLSTRGAS